MRQVPAGRRLLLLLVFVIAAGRSAMADSFPYQAYLSGSDIYVRSGPGKSYYPTDKLHRGTPVEVWRHDPGGWYAIRPPEGSYSWVSADNVKVGKDDLGEITGQKVIAYVGSLFSDVHDVHQVQMDEGELVEIVGEKRFVSPQEGVAETWYKIAPPRGEFRWVFGRFVVREGIPATTAQRDDAGVRPGRPAADDDDSGWRDPQGTTNGATDRGTVRLAASSRPAEVDGAALPPRPLRRPAVPASAASEIVAIDQELSMVIAEPADTWQFAELRGRAQRALAAAETAIGRGRARLVLDEIAKYEALQQDYADLDRLRTASEREFRIWNRPPEVLIPSNDSYATDLADFDGVGRLTPVVSRRIGSPSYALTDPQGEVVMFLTPSPTTDLEPYVGRHVGLKGTRGFMSELNTPHLTVRQIQPVSEAERIARRPE